MSLSCFHHHPLPPLNEWRSHPSLQCCMSPLFDTIRKMIPVLDCCVFNLKKINNGSLCFEKHYTVVKMFKNMVHSPHAWKCGNILTENEFLFLYVSNSDTHTDTQECRGPVSTGDKEVNNGFSEFGTTYLSHLSRKDTAEQTGDPQQTDMTWAEGHTL